MKIMIFYRKKNIRMRRTSNKITLIHIKTEFYFGHKTLKITIN